MSSDAVTTPEALPPQDTAAQPAAAGASKPWPSPRVAWYAVFVFALALMVNFLDRGIVSLLVEPIKRDLGLTDVQISLLMGFAYVFFYVIVGLPVARLADYGSRKHILGVGLALWGVMTGLCGLAQNFWQMFLFRMGVGMGESCSGPPTFSMLADLFPKEKLPRAIAVLNFGFVAGNGGALILGGTIVAVLLALPPFSVPFIGELRGWQLAFLLAGLPGLLVSILLLTTVPEPVRRGAAAQSELPPVREVLRYLRDNGAVYAPIFIGVALSTMYAFGSSMWFPAFYIRNFGWSPAQVGLIQGCVYLLVWPAGAIVGSLLAERFARQGHDDANMRIVIIAHILAVPPMIAMPLMPTAWLAMTVSAFSAFFSAWTFGPQNAALQVVTPNRMRGQITALFLFVFNVVGFGFGPTLVAMITEHVYTGSGHALAYSLTTVAAVLGPGCTLVLWLGVRPYARAVARARAWD